MIIDAIIGGAVACVIIIFISSVKKFAKKQLKK